MKKRLCLLMLATLVSCVNHETTFDSDFDSIATSLKEINNEQIIKLEKKQDSLYDYNFSYLDIGVKAYYTKLKSDYSYAFVLTLSYQNTRIEDIRALVVSINDNNYTFAQIGFDGNKKIIDSYNESTSSTYKGIQTFVTPFSKDTSITRFYLESASFEGGYFEINDIKEI